MDPRWKPFEAEIMEAFELILHDVANAAEIPKALLALEEFIEIPRPELDHWLALQNSFLLGEVVRTRDDELYCDEHVIAHVLTYAMDRFDDRDARHYRYSSALVALDLPERRE